MGAMSETSAMIAIIILSLAVVFLSALAMYYREALEKARRELAESKEWSDRWCRLFNTANREIGQILQWEDKSP